MTWRRLFVALLAVVVSSGCFAPHSKVYRPDGAIEEQLFPRARRDVYPEDVRADPAHLESTLLWTGIVRSVKEVEPGKYALLVEHHYWDWIEDYSIQKEIAFLSPQGEGLFQCQFLGEPNAPSDNIARVGAMAIVYVVPKQVARDRTIIAACPFYKTLRQELYATDIFDYGRNGAGLKMLRIPGR